ncbi:MAG TPA: c-type cytochrome [Chitinophagaceae bacterium]|nr:c-type cytochrome [Chitinophagaceae bacterium]
MKSIFSHKRFFGLLAFAVLFYSCNNKGSGYAADAAVFDTTHLWHGWNKYHIPENDTLARYGYQLIANTSYYLGPKGTVAQIANGMNCQNCHLNGGTVPWGNNYGAVASTYPQFRARSGGLETVVKRISDCMERSLNADKAVDSNSKEMKAIIAYINWLGDGIPKKYKPKGSGIKEVPLLDRAADPQKGQMVYINKCQRCHGAGGQGQKKIGDTGYEYPPLWGQDSYNTAAGLYRISRFAGYVKHNMPFGEVNYHNPQLTDEEAWDVAAFVNSQPRPSKVFKEDWPDISKKPYDHPFGPFADSFNEEQHKYGPFKPIIEARRKQVK